MTGHHRFLHTQGGKCSFARVWVEVWPDHEADEIVDALSERSNSDAGEFNRYSAPTWVTAALDGIRLTVNQARQAGLLVAPCRIELTKLVGSVLDTREDVVRCTAALAAWEGLGLPAPAPDVEYDGQSWRVLFPVPVSSPAQGVES